MPATADLGFVPDAPSVDLGFVPDNSPQADVGFIPDAASPPLKVALDPYQEIRMRTGQTDPGLANTTDFLSAVVNDPRLGIKKDAPLSVLTGPIKAVGRAIFKPLTDYLPKETPQQALLRNARQMNLADQVSPDTDLATMPDSVPSKYAAGVTAGAENLAKGLLSPVGLATLGIGALPTTAQRGVSLAFAAQMAHDTPELASQLGEEFGKPTDQRDKEKIANLLTQAAGTAAFTTLAAKHGLTPVESPRVSPLANAEAVAASLPEGFVPKQNFIQAGKPKASAPDLGFVPDQAPPPATQPEASNVAPAPTGSEVLPPETAKPVETPVSPPVADMSAPVTKGDLLDAIKELKESMTFNPGRQVEPVRTPDGTVDPVQTAIAQMRENARPEPPAALKEAQASPLAETVAAPVEPAAPESEIGKLSKEENPLPADDQLHRIRMLEAAVQNEFSKRGAENPGDALMSIVEGKKLTPDQYEAGLQKMLDTLKGGKLPPASEVESGAGLTPPRENATTEAVAPVTSTVRSVGSDTSNERQRGRVPGNPGMTAESGSNPDLGAAAQFQNGQRVTVALRSGGKEHFAKIIQLQPDGSATVKLDSEPGYRQIPSDRIFKTKTQAAREAKAQEIADLPEDQRSQTKADAEEFTRLFKEHGPHPDVGWFSPEALSESDIKAQGVENSKHLAGGMRRAMRDLGLPDADIKSQVDRANALPRLKEFIEKKGITAVDPKKQKLFIKDVGLKSKGTEPLSMDDLREGAEFSLKGAKFVVRKLDYDEDGRITHVILDDGKIYGTQEFFAERPLRMDKGSLEKSDPGVADFTPAENEKPAPAKPSEVANKLAQKLEDLKTGIAEGGQLHAFGIAADLWDRAVSIAQKVIRAGGSIADAIAAAIDHIKANHKGVFDEQGARAKINEAVRDEAMDRGESEAPKQPPERERSMAQVKSEAADALEALRHASRVSANPSMRGGLSSKEARSAMYLATAKHRLLRDELLHHPDYIAEQLKQQHDAIEEANAILKPHGMAIRPDTFPNPSTLAQVLKPEQVKRVGELQRLIDEAHQELVQMPKKMVTRVHSEMQDDGRLPKSSPIPENAGRTLSKMTAFLRGNKFDSPKGTFAERLALGKRFAARLEGIKNTATKAWLNAQAAWKAMVETYKHPPIDDDFRNVMKHWFEYDQRTSHENYQYVKALTDAVPLPARRAGISVWLDANGDRAVLESQRQQVPEKYAHIWDAALKLTPGEIKIAQQIRADFEAKLDDARSAGLIDKGRENYGVPQRWKVAPEGDANPDPYSEGKKGSPGNPYAKLDPRDPFFSFERKTPSYFDGIMNGGEPENLDVAHLVSVYDESFHKALSSRGAIAALQHAKAKDGLPVVKISGKASMSSAEGGKAYFVDSRARHASDVTADGRPYRFLDHFALKDWKLAFKDEKGNPIIVKGDMLIHPDHFTFIKNELSKPSWTDENSGMLGAGLRAGLKASAFLKASKFIGPFHVVTEALHASFHGVAPSVHGFNIDLADPKQALLNRNMTLGFGHAREMFEEGLSSHGGIWGHVPGLGDAVVAMNHFTFNEYIPRLKMKVGLAVLDRNMARYKGKLTDEQIGELTGRQMDAAFGGQNWRLMGTNKNSMIAARLGFVAPDFLLSRSKVIAQAFKPYNAEQRYFLLAQAAGVYVLSRILNTIFSDDHDPHFEFKNWDSVVIGKRAYHARFLVSDAAALAQDLIGMRQGNGIPFITGRLGVVPKTGIEALTGKDLFTGQSKDVPIEAHGAFKAFEIVAKDVAEWMTPMGVDGFLPGAAGEGQSGYTSAAAALVGVSSRKETATGDVYNLASEFNRKSGDPATLRYQKERDNSSHGESAYRTLDNLLDAGKMDAAQKAYDALVADGHTPQSIKIRYSHSYAFTGKGHYDNEDSREGQFYASLTPQQKKTYDRAVEERQARLDQFEKLEQADAQ